MEKMLGRGFPIYREAPLHRDRDKARACVYPACCTLKVRERLHRWDCKCIMMEEYSVKSYLYHFFAKGDLKIFAPFLLINEMVDKGKRCRSRSVLGTPRAALPFQRELRHMCCPMAQTRSALCPLQPQWGRRNLQLASSPVPAHCICVQLAGWVSGDSLSEMLENLMHRALFSAEVPPVEKLFLLEVNSDVMFEGFCSLFQWGTGTPRQISNVLLFKCF